MTYYESHLLFINTVKNRKKRKKKKKTFEAIRTLTTLSSSTISVLYGSVSKPADSKNDIDNNICQYRKREGGGTSIISGRHQGRKRGRKVKREREKEIG